MDSPLSSDPSSPPAGWYADPEHQGQARYWDGRLWTAHRQPLPAVAVADRAPRRLHPFAVAAILGLIAAAGAEMASIFIDLSCRGFVGGILGGEPGSYSRYLELTTRLHDVTLALVVAVLVSTVTFLPWFFQGHANIRRSGIGGSRFGNGWAVGSWFVPILNLWRPKQIANDIYRASQPEARTGTPLNSIAVAGVVHWWWGLLLLGSLVTRIGGSMVAVGCGKTITSQAQLYSYLNTEHTGWTVLAAGHALNIGAAIMAIIFITRVTSGQSDAAERPESHGVPAVAHG